MGYWQHSLEGTMPERDLNGNGWDVDRNVSGRKAEGFTGRICVLSLSGDL